MSGLTREQRTVFEALGREGRCTGYFLAKELTDRQRGISWSSERVCRVMQQLKYRGLVEFHNGTWRPIAPATPPIA